MKDPLDAARLKVVRAQEHLDSLKAEIRMYLGSDPYEFPIEQRGDTWNAEVVAGEPPIRLSTIIGDCLGNSRAALDYIVWQLVGKHFTPPIDLTKQGDRNLASFPIKVHPGDTGFANKLKRFATRAMPKSAIEEIEAVQPQQSGYEPLGWLRRLVNDDKHRLLLLTRVHAHFDNVEVVKRVGGVATTLGSARGAIRVGWTDSSLPAKSAGAAGKMEVHGQASGFVALRDDLMPREPVDRTLEQIVECVANVIPRFERFL